MNAFERERKLEQFIKWALECSIHVAPSDHGLTFEELITAAVPFGYEKGEVADFLQTHAYYPEGGRYQLNAASAHLADFIPAVDPELRSIRAWDFILGAFRDMGRKEGADYAMFGRPELIGQGEASGIDRHELEAAIAMMLHTGRLELKGDILTVGRTYRTYPLPSEQLAQTRSVAKVNRSGIERVHAAVKDVISRRTDGRPSSSDPLVAFEARVEVLGHRLFRPWWRQTVAELRRLTPQTMPVATAILSAALVEGALVFLVDYARKNTLGFASKDFEKPARAWKIEDLIKSAGPDANRVLPKGVHGRADDLIKVRQRIHVGGLMEAYAPQGVPDLRSNEAADAKATAEAVVQAIMDWLDKHPAPGK